MRITVVGFLAIATAAIGVVIFIIRLSKTNKVAAYVADNAER